MEKMTPALWAEFCDNKKKLEAINPNLWPNPDPLKDAVAYNVFCNQYFKSRRPKVYTKAKNSIFSRPVVSALGYWADADTYIGDASIVVSSPGSLVTTQSHAIIPVHNPQLVNHHHPLNRGLVNWWYATPSLDGGKWWYDIVGGRHADVTNCAAWQRTPMRKGGVTSHSFTNASAQYASFPSVTFSGEFTISFWFWVPTSGISSNVCIGSGNTASSSTNKIGFNAGGYAIRILHGGTLVGNSTNPTDGLWHLYTVTRNAANKIDYFIDKGAAVRLFSDTAQSGDSTWAEFGRAQATGAPQYFQGSLDDCRFYNRALSAPEVAELWQQSTLAHNETLNRTIYLPAGLHTETIAETGKGKLKVTGPGSTVTQHEVVTGTGKVLISGGNSTATDGNTGSGGIVVSGVQSDITVVYHEQTCCTYHVDGTTSVSLTDGGSDFFGIYAGDVAAALGEAVSELNADFPQTYGACEPGDCSAWGGSGAGEQNGCTAALSFSYGGETEFCTPESTGALKVTLTSPGPEYVDISDIITNMNPAFADPTYGDSNGWNYPNWLTLAKAAADTTCELNADYGTHKFYLSDLSAELGTIAGSTLPADTRVSCAVSVYPTYIIVGISCYNFMSTGPSLGATYDTDGNLLILTSVDCTLSDEGDTQSGCWPSDATVTRSFSAGLGYEVDVAFGGLEGGGVGFDLSDNGMIEADSSYSLSVSDCVFTYSDTGSGKIVVSGDSTVFDTIPGTGKLKVSSPGSDVLVTYTEIGHGSVVVGSGNFFAIGGGKVVISSPGSRNVLVKLQKTITVPAGRVGSDLNGFYLGTKVDLADRDLSVWTEFAVKDSTGLELGSEVRHFDGETLLFYFSCNLLADEDNVFRLYSEEL